MISLAVKYRPQTLEETVGQDAIVKVLTRQIINNEFKNAYLFSGASGCGKTTVARAFAKKINNNIGEPIEIDAASNSGVDNVRLLIANAQERSIVGKYKIYIIDECHSLSNQAWQAFLKCIEEPPAFTIFIFCTTDPQKIPATILNRVQRFNFSRLNSSLIEQRLSVIAEHEAFTNYNDSIAYISKICNGSMREAISLLEKCASYSKEILLSNVFYVLGKSAYTDYFKLINYVIDNNQEGIIELHNQIIKDNNDMKLFVDDFISFCLDIVKYCLFKDCNILTIPNSMEEEIKNCTNFDNANKYYCYVLDKLLELKTMLKTDINPNNTVLITLLQIARCQ